MGRVVIVKIPVHSLTQQKANKQRKLVLDKAEHAPIRNVYILVEMDGFFGNLVGGE
jgi:hypothetical protein